MTKNWHGEVETFHELVAGTGKADLDLDMVVSFLSKSVQQIQLLADVHRSGVALAWDSAAGPAPGLGAVRRSRAGRRVDRKWGTCVITVSRATLDTRVVGATERRAHERRARQAASDRERRWRSRAPGLGGGWPPTFAVLLVRSTVPRGEYRVLCSTWTRDCTHVIHTQRSPSSLYFNIDPTAG
ncbi:hypothetical protein BDA96_10G231900 [Sorghum bicolor]|uniref:Uncharacterized protein n=1 Tax=Sorghum bicolor TaxID=4558 RepID=A0A921U179_SORBI|nr:hypothetical protein BDA96_10G231900 [Sorghum bicolor]